MSRRSPSPADAGDTLFSAIASASAPLAERMRPTSLDEIVGQDHLLAHGRPLGDAMRAGRVGNLILTGPPGTGKTTLAQLIGAYTDRVLVTMNAVTDGIPQLRDVVKAAEERRRLGKATTLFIDELHRFSRTQQDALLPHVERGTIALIAATTENPNGALVGALLSRCRVVALRALTASDIEALLDRAIADATRGLGAQALVPEPGAVAWLAAQAEGDARRALTTLEAAAYLLPDRAMLTRDALRDAMGMVVAPADRQGATRWDVLSAFHKTVRCSQPDAALYWLARGLAMGEDPRVFARRLAVIASEDVGLAEPMALPTAMAAWEAFERLGPAEGERTLAHATVFLATAPKSNRLYLAWTAAREAAARTSGAPVPANLLNTEEGARPDPAMRSAYRYPFDYPDWIVAQPYLPPEVQAERFYAPGPFGAEKTIGERLAWWATRLAACAE